MCKNVVFRSLGKVDVFKWCFWGLNLDILSVIRNKLLILKVSNALICV